MGEAIISGVIFGFCALIMLLIGISQCRSKKPVGFYTGEKPPEESALTDVSAWNKKHGAMWIAYGICIALSWVGGLFWGESLLMIAAILVPIPLMILWHHRLLRKYGSKK